MNPEIITVFLPAFTTMIAEDMLRLEVQKAPGIALLVSLFILVLRRAL